MSRKPVVLLNRRQFISKGMGGCTLVCLAGNPALALIGQESSKKIPHIFDTHYPGSLTFKQLSHAQYSEFIKFAKFLIQELGEDKLMRILKKQTEQRMLKFGQEQAKKMQDTSLQSFAKQFKGPNNFKYTLKKEIVEDTEKTFALKITDCLWATTFLKNKAAEIGFARVCYGEYFWAKGFNANIKMIRSKTLMQGFDCCNPRYILEGRVLK